MQQASFDSSAGFSPIHGKAPNSEFGFKMKPVLVMELDHTFLSAAAEFVYLAPGNN